MADYDHFTHRHNFSTWAAARAAQRGLTSIKLLKNALEESGVVEFLEEPDCLDTSRERFDELHRAWCRRVVEHLREAGVRNVSFGRAAKLIAVYLKSMVVIGVEPECELARVAHPPIDAILLKNLSKATKSKQAGSDQWGKIRWTQLTEQRYYELIDQLKACLSDDDPLWLLERHWTVT